MGRENTKGCRTPVLLSTLVGQASFTQLPLLHWTN